MIPFLYKEQMKVRDTWLLDERGGRELRVVLVAEKSHLASFMLYSTFLQNFRVKQRVMCQLMAECLVTSIFAWEQR